MKSSLVYDVNTAIVPNPDPLHLDPKPLVHKEKLPQPIGNDVEQVWELNQWKPRVAFGVSIASSQTPIIISINEEAVTFASKCVYDKPETISDEQWFPLKRRAAVYALPTGDAISSVFSPEKWELIRQQGRVVLPVKTKASWQYWSTCVLRPEICRRTRQEPVWFEAPIIQSPTVLMNVEETCPKFGSGPGPFVDKAACSSFPGAFTTCAYPVQSHLVGKCSTKQCVLDGIDMFARTYDALGTKSGDTDPEDPTIDPTTILGLNAKLRRDATLARLWEGSTTPGQCATADPTLSCLSLLDTDCSKIFEFATKVQPHSQQLYDAVVKAGQVCARKQ
jgi:hypothetical protein